MRGVLAEEVVEAAEIPQNLGVHAADRDRLLRADLSLCAVFLARRKYLRDVPLAAAASAPEGKFVFVYRDKHLNVWFSHGKATGLGQDGGSDTNPSGSPGRR